MLVAVIERSYWMNWSYSRSRGGRGLLFAFYVIVCACLGGGSRSRRSRWVAVERPTEDPKISFVRKISERYLGE